MPADNYVRNNLDNIQFMSDDLYSEGVLPVIFLKIVLKEVLDLKPESKAILSKL
jgi:hypothetical protein